MLDALTSSLNGLPGQPKLQNAEAKGVAVVPNSNPNIIEDFLDLSPEARKHVLDGRKALETLKSIPGALQQQELSFAKQQIAEIRNEFQQFTAMFQSASSSQLGILSQGIDSIASRLKAVTGRILELLPQDTGSGFDFSYLNVSFSETQTSVSVESDGDKSFLSIQQTSQQVSLSIAQFNGTLASF